MQELSPQQREEMIQLMAQMDKAKAGKGNSPKNNNALDELQRKGFTDAAQQLVARWSAIMMSPSGLVIEKDANKDTNFIEDAIKSGKLEPGTRQHLEKFVKAVKEGDLYFIWFEEPLSKHS